MMWKPISVFVLVSVVVCGVLGFRIGALTKAASLPEKEYIASVDSAKKIARNPVLVVHKLPTYVLFKLGAKRVTLYRLVSAAFTALAVVSCFFILREWFSDRIALLGTGLFLSSAWVLHIGRLATPEASYFLILPLTWAAIWLYATTLRKTALIVLSLLSGLSFYIPGFGLLLIAVAIWQRKRIWVELKQVPVWFRIACAAGILLLLLPLILASIRQPDILLLAAGLPSNMPAIANIGRQAVAVPEYLLVRGPHDAVRWLGRLPLLDAFSSVMLLLGIYNLRFTWRLVRSQLLFAGAIYFGLLVSLGGPMTITILIPIVYVLIAAGITFLLQQWYGVFPRNPIARGIASTLVVFVVLLTSAYHLTHYFVAWPGAPETKAHFTYSLLK